MKFFRCKHDYQTVAIDTNHKWFFVAKPDECQEHIIRYVKCSKCGDRGMEYDDPDQESRTYAMNHNSGVAKSRTLWINAGRIRQPQKDKNIVWVDPAYAPLGSFEKYFDAIKQDPALKDLLSESMVDDALGQLEVAVKLHQNNTKE